MIKPSLAPSDVPFVSTIAESIGYDVFMGCIFTNFRVPPLITVIPESMLYECQSMFSLELPENATEIENGT